MTITSAAGIAFMLDETHVELQEFALKKLNNIVDEFWPEISESLHKIEIIFEDNNLPRKQLAALLISKLYYHLGNYDKALNYALEAKCYIDFSNRNDFVDTMLNTAMDRYIVARQKGVADSCLEDVVNGIFNKCFDDGEFKQAIGLAVECRRLDLVEYAVKKSSDLRGMLQYAYEVCSSQNGDRNFRDLVLRTLILICKSLDKPDYMKICEFSSILKDSKSIAEILYELLSEGGKESVLIAYKIAFDLYDGKCKRFLINVSEDLKIMKKDSKKYSLDNEKDTLQDIECKNDDFNKLLSILKGDITVGLQSQFLVVSNLNTDDNIPENILKNVKDSVCTTAVVFCHAFMQAGTKNYDFLKNYQDLIYTVTDWDTFNIVSSLGVIHKGNEKDSLEILQEFVSKIDYYPTSYYIGGLLYALGIVHSNRGEDIIDYLKVQMNINNDVIQHGGCLGLGLAALGTNRQDLYELLKVILHNDSAVCGDAAGVAIGMIVTGSGRVEGVEEMLAYVKETEHVKIQRGLAIGIALAMFGKVEEADDLIKVLIDDANGILREAACLIIATANCGDGRIVSIRKILNIVATDPDDSVRRTAATSLGFILKPEQCVSIANMLVDSHNPYVRYGAAMALGISCASTRCNEALVMLRTLLNDSESFVRQGALIASSMILVQGNDDSVCSEAKYFREMYNELSNNVEDCLVKMGAILALGIIDAGGKNVTLSLYNRNGEVNMPSVVGMLCFSQYWNWYPLIPMLSLAFSSTLDYDFERGPQATTAIRN